MQSTNLLYVTLIATAAALGGFLFGFDSAVINGAVSGIQQTYHSSTMGTGFAVASILLGCAAGALVGGRLADAVGRRPTMLATAVIFAVTAIGSGLASSSTSFVVARFLSGIAVGAASVVCPAYIAEVSPARIRGRLATLQQMGIVIGIFIALVSDEALSRTAGGVTAPSLGGYEAWRVMFLVEVVPSILFGVAAIVLPESPRFLVARGRDAEALKILQRVEPSTPYTAIAEIRGTVHDDKPPRLADLLDDEGKVRSIVWVGVALATLQQLVGINSVFYYGAVLWESVGFTSGDSLRINVVTGLVNVISTFVAMALVDRIGRKPLLLGGSIGMALMLGILVVTFAGGTTDPTGHIALSERAGIVALVSANAYVFCFGVSWGPCVWVLLGEMFPNSIRAASMAVAVFGQWIANWLVTVSFPPIVAATGPAGAYAGYCLFALVSFVFVQRAITETRGRTLEQAG